MSYREYHEFDLLIEPTGQGYSARVLDSPTGQASTDFKLPFSDLEIENFVLRLGRSRGAARRVESSEMAAAKSFGSNLFEAVFAGDVRSCLRASLDEASREGGGLRMRLHLARVPELGDLPWEFLYDPALNRFLGLSVETPIVRYLDLPERVRALAVKPPLRILAMVSSPQDFPRLDVEREYGNLRRALEPLVASGLLALERLTEPTLAGLQRRLREGEYHVFHFIGHGGFDRQAQDGVLIFEAEDGRGRQVGAQYLGTVLHDHRSLRLAVLNACEGARGARDDPFSGTAQGLVQQGIPAVIAMQFEISDEAAVIFSQELYSAVAVGYPVDAALAEARKAIFAQVNELEWGTPVLYMRAPDGRIFDVQEVGERERTAALTTVAGGTGEPLPPSAVPPVPVKLPPGLPVSPVLAGTPAPTPPIGTTTVGPQGPAPIRVTLPPGVIAPAPPPAKRAAPRILLAVLAILIALVFLIKLGGRDPESPGAKPPIEKGSSEPASTDSSEPASTDSSEPAAAPKTPSMDSEAALKESLETALSRAQAVENEALRTLSTRKLSTVLMGAELSAARTTIDNLRKQGVYLVTTGTGREILSFGVRRDSNGTKAELRVHETIEGGQFLSQATGECVARMPWVEGDATIFLERHGENWLIAATQAHYAAPAPVACEEDPDKNRRKNIERSFKYME